MDPFTMQMIMQAFGAMGGANSGYQQQKLNYKDEQNALRLTQDQQRFQRGYMNQAEGLLRQGLGSLLGGYGQARGELGRAARASKQQTVDRERQGLGAIQSQLTSRGLGNTTIGANLQRGAMGDTSRRLQEIDSGLASLLSSLSERQGMNTAAQYGGLANFAQRRGTSERDLYGNLMQLGVPQKPKQSNLSKLYDYSFFGNKGITSGFGLW